MPPRGVIGAPSNSLLDRLNLLLAATGGPLLLPDGLTFGPSILEHGLVEGVVLSQRRSGVCLWEAGWLLREGNSANKGGSMSSSS